MVVVLGALLCLMAFLLLLFITFSSSTPRLPLDRRRPPRLDEAPPSVLSRVTGITTGAIADTLNRHGWTRSITDALDRAGLRLSPADFLVLVGAAGLVSAILGFLVGGPLLGLLLLVLAPLGGKVFLGLAVGKRRRAFADQLDDTLQLLAGSLRAGHSLLRAVDAVSMEAQAPTNEELARVVNQTRLGRDLNTALDETEKNFAMWLRKLASADQSRRSGERMSFRVSEALSSEESRERNVWATRTSAGSRRQSVSTARWVATSRRFSTRSATPFGSATRSAAKSDH